jgi:hypothetical protein
MIETTFVFQGALSYDCQISEVMVEGLDRKKRAAGS